jgi:hypothetical protein
MGGFDSLAGLLLVREDGLAGGFFSRLFRS